MGEWLQEETGQIAETIRAIDRCVIPRRKSALPRDVVLRMSDSEPFTKELSGGFGAVFVRQLVRQLGFDEHRQLQWRLEHKLQQALVLNHYCPGSVPRTGGVSLRAYLNSGRPLHDVLGEEFPAGYFVKKAMNDSSGDRGKSDATESILQQSAAGHLTPADRPRVLDEEWIVQQRISIHKENRVHTMEDRIIEDLSFLRYGKGQIPHERVAPNAYIKSILDRLPPAMVGESLLGWDVAWTDAENFVVIEVNFSGFHQVYRRGFQCSGYFQDRDWGANSTARLLRFLERNDSISFRIEPDVDGDTPARRYYCDVVRWAHKLRGSP